MSRSVSFAHIVNPVRVGPESDLAVAQPITFESMCRARDFCRARHEVTLLSAQFAEDRGVAPDDFAPTPDLDRSVLDVGSFAIARKLPLIADILGRLLAAAPDADHYVYSNVDIALMPAFYDAVAAEVADGARGITITRRTIPAGYRTPAELPRMYGEIGKPHPGLDCFIMPRAVLAEGVFHHTCIGMNFVGQTVLANMIALGAPVQVLRHAHLTFHVGDDRRWKDDRFADLRAHNRRQYQFVLRDLERRVGAIDRDSPAGRLLWTVDGRRPPVAGDGPGAGGLVRRIKRATKAWLSASRT